MHHLNDTLLREVPFPAMRRKSDLRLTTHQKQILCSVGAVACFASELIHLWLLPEQYEVFIGYGLIFFLIALAQGVIGANFLFAPRRRLLTFGLWVNGSLVFLYLFTHTVGVLVAEAFLPLPVDPFGVAATLCEMLGIGILFLLRRESPKEPKRKKTRGSVQRRHARSASDLLLTPFSLHSGALHYLGTRSPQTPLASPVYADLHGLPPLFIQVGGDELLLDDIHAFARHAEAAGVTVQVEEWPRMFHVWQMMAATLPEAQRALEHLACFIAAVLEEKENERPQACESYHIEPLSEQECRLSFQHELEGIPPVLTFLVRQVIATTMASSLERLQVLLVRQKQR